MSKGVEPTGRKGYGYRRGGALDAGKNFGGGLRGSLMRVGIALGIVSISMKHEFRVVFQPHRSHT